MISRPAYQRARMRFLQSGEVEPDLLELLRLAASRLIRFGGLPAIYSPTGRWDHDAEDAALSDWFARRLLGEKPQLPALLHQAATPESFARLGELYLRRHLINRLARNYASNLYPRVRAMLTDHADFAPSETEGFFKLAGTSPAPFDGEETELLRAAWRLGDFDVIQYREDARKLSPVLETLELHRFTRGLLEECGCALSLRHVMRALVLRFDLEPAGLEPLGDFEEMLGSPEPPAIEVVSAQRAATAALVELSQRQVAVLKRQLGGATVREIAPELAVSVGTVHAEQRQIATILGRVADSEGASRGLMLNGLRDLLFSS